MGSKLDHRDGGSRKMRSESWVEAQLGACKGRCDTIVFGVNLLEGLVGQGWSGQREMIRS